MKTDRSAVFKDAHKRYRYARSRGWTDVTFAQSLSLAWAAERIRRDRRIIVTQWERRSMWRCHKPIWDLRHAA
jgi:hypothetical protein